MRLRINSLKNMSEEKNIIHNKYLIVGAKKLKVLFGYEDLKSNIINIVTDTKNGLNIIYEIYDNLNDVKNYLDTDITWNYTEYPLNSHYANWMGNVASATMENGLKATFGEVYSGWKRTKKRKLTIDELNDILNKQYVNIHSNILSEAKKRVKMFTQN